jgi:hypothetical protein
MKHYKKQGTLQAIPRRWDINICSSPRALEKKGDTRIKGATSRQNYQHGCEKRYLYGIGISVGFGLCFSQNFRSLDEDAGIPRGKWLQDAAMWADKEKKSE